MTVSGCFAPQVTLPSDREIRVLCILDAPPETVFAAWTEPAHLGRWRAPGCFELVRCEADVRPGGAWRHVLRDPDGDEYGYGGTYRRVEPDTVLAYSERFDGVPVETTVSVELVALCGVTKLTMTLSYASAEQRDRCLTLGIKAETGRMLGKLNTYVRRRETCAA